MMSKPQTPKYRKTVCERTVSLGFKRCSLLFVRLTDASSVFGSNVDLDLSSVDSSIPSVVPPPVDGSSGVDFLSSLSQMGDNLLRSPPPAPHSGGGTERPSTASAPAEAITSSAAVCPGSRDSVAVEGRRAASPSSPRAAAVEPSSSTGDVDAQTTPPSGGGAAVEAPAADPSATATTTTTDDGGGGGSADVDSIEFACNLTFDTTDLIDAGARHEVIDVTNACFVLFIQLCVGLAALLNSSVDSTGAPKCCFSQ